METRKVQQLGSSTVAMTLPAEWASAQGVTKGDEVSVRTHGSRLVVVPPSATEGPSEAVVQVDDVPTAGLEHAIIGQYALGRRTIRVETDGDVLEGDAIDAAYAAERQLMGVGVVEERETAITIRCSVDPADFTVDDLLEQLAATGRTMRTEAVTALSRGDGELAERALGRERQANRIFVLLFRLLFSAVRDPTFARTVGLAADRSLTGYRAIARNLELAADRAGDVATIALEADGHTLAVDGEAVREIRTIADRLDEMTERAVAAAIEREYETTVAVRRTFQDLDGRVEAVLASLPELPNEELLQVRDVLVSLQQTAEYAMRTAEIATNLALEGESEYVSRR